MADAQAKQAEETAQAAATDKVFENLPDTLIAPADGPTPILTGDFGPGYEAVDFYLGGTVVSDTSMGDVFAGWSLLGPATPHFMPSDLGFSGMPYDWVGYAAGMPFGRVVFLQQMEIKFGATDISAGTPSGVQVGAGYYPLQDQFRSSSQMGSRTEASRPNFVPDVLASVDRRGPHYSVDQLSLLDPAITPSEIHGGGYSRSPLPTSPGASQLASGTTKSATASPSSSFSLLSETGQTGSGTTGTAPETPPAEQNSPQEPWAQGNNNGGTQACDASTANNAAAVTIVISVQLVEPDPAEEPKAIDDRAGDETAKPQGEDAKPRVQLLASPDDNPWAVHPKVVVGLQVWAQSMMANTPAERWNDEVDGLLKRFEDEGAPLNPALADRFRSFMADASAKAQHSERMSADLSAFVTVAGRHKERMRIVADHEEWLNSPGDQFLNVIFAEGAYFVNGATFGATKFADGGDFIMQDSVIAGTGWHTTAKIAGNAAGGVTTSVIGGALAGSGGVMGGVGRGIQAAEAADDVRNIVQGGLRVMKNDPGGLVQAGLGGLGRLGGLGGRQAGEVGDASRAGGVDDAFRQLDQADEAAKTTAGKLDDVAEAPVRSAAREQPRNALGQFMPPSRAGQAIPGSSAVDDFVAQASSNGYEIVGREISVRTPFGRRTYDVVIRDTATRKVIGVEIKSSRDAFDKFDAAARQQYAADKWLLDEGGLPAIGKSEGVFINFTIKILWEAP